ncbi:metallophosphoesterase family protein [Poseidonibacter lekithochrous]|uniref:metallophosphoesterase family protein n=1 Tax=Poseidonibacter lekithochrous TaxID=1904463 RepID=UPI0008FCBA96|nr:metallophosphoesterase family protein [Poseidonibacter lekithochrous]QKJ22593.1 serine/threonine protein phosphatase [Poseidonibacter lekithochrous]
MNDTLENTYVISDIHGCYFSLLDLIKKLPSDAKLIFVGDLCDRGLYSKEVIEYVKSNNHTCILGNHDFYMIEHLKECLNGAKVRWNIKEYMGGRETIANYKGDNLIIEEHISWLKTLPQYIQIEKYFITHAFCMPYYKRRDDKEKSHAMMVNRVSDEEEWLWDWEENWKDYDLLNIYGHENSDEIVKSENYLCIDTGCVYGNKLTALNLGNLKVTQVVLNKKDITI